ncbi:uncharacterized protein LOC111639350 [Centruroides sculpturatus]|uniref:uncharacterized protein LOC111639350 n=1 Tax=Centruroides sculpturatus TaxID=218467 RepID=UPI000C6EC40A|nr:uncharacterized protein LOC111639350 [Centruroides sculpturatus]
MARPLSLLVLIFVTVEAAVIRPYNVQIINPRHQQLFMNNPALNRMNRFRQYQLVYQPMNLAYPQEQVVACPQHPRHSIGNCPHHQQVICPHHRPEQYALYPVNQQQQFMPSLPYQQLQTVFISPQPQEPPVSIHH